MKEYLSQRVGEKKSLAADRHGYSQMGKRISRQDAEPAKGMGDID